MKKRVILWNYDFDFGGFGKSDFEFVWEIDDWEKNFICRIRLKSVGRCVMIEESKFYLFFIYIIRIYFYWDLIWKNLIFLESILVFYFC